MNLPPELSGATVRDASWDARPFKYIAYRAVVSAELLADARERPTLLVEPDSLGDLLLGHGTQPEIDTMLVEDG